MGNTESSEIKRLQRKLIPLNLVIAIISLVAAFTLFFMPFLKVDCGKLIENTSEVESGANSGETSTGSQDISDVGNMLSNVEISISTYSLTQTAFKENPVAGMLRQYVFNDKMEDYVISCALIYALTGSAENAVTQEQLSAVDLTEISAIIDRLETEKPEDVSADLYNEIKVQCAAAGIEVEVNEADVSSVVQEVYDEVVKNTENGEFSKEALICVMVSEMTESETISTSYEELIDVLANSGVEGTEQVSNVLDMADQYSSIVLKVLFALSVFPVLIWIILFLFSFLHIFAKNKRFTMWYAKLFGAGPCVLFWLIPALFKLLAPTLENILGAELVATLTGVLGAVSSMAWISGICYLLMWIISIFWAFPIKRKIRRLQREA